MGLFQKKILPVTTPRYSLGHQETVLVVGLGNIGKEYASTRHNVGFMILDEFAQREDFNPWVEKRDLKAILCAQILNGKKVILCKPTTMMNVSGEALRAVQQFYKISDESTCVIYDELDLPLGSLRTGSGGSSAGHNGIKSLIQHSENKFWRVRVGIGPKTPEQIDTADFVLQAFSQEQQATLTKITKETISVLSEWVNGTAEAETRKI